MSVFSYFAWFIWIDHDGPYYWHIKSGTIQRELPVSDKSEQEKANINNFSHCADDFISSYENTICSVTRSSTSSALDTDLEERKLKESYKYVYRKKCK